MWSQLVPILIAATALLYVPGVLVGAAARLRPPLVVGLAPAISIALITGTGIVAPVLAVPWGPVPVAVAALLLSLAALASRLVMAQRHPERRTAYARGRLRPGAVAIWCAAWPLSAAVTMLTVTHILDAPDAISQTYDAVFHLNAVEWILRTDNASSLRFFLEAPQGGVYPLGWHALVALAMRLCDATSIPAATNAIVLVVAGIVWTSGCLSLAHVLFHGRPSALLVTAVMSGSFTAFPFVLLSWGVLYPNFLAIALLPSLLAAARELIPMGPGARTRPAGLLLPAGVIGAGGLGLCQPNTVATLLLALVALTTARLIATLRMPCDERSANRIRRQGLAAGGLLAALVVTWLFLRPDRSGAIWGPSYATSGSIGEAVTAMPVQLPLIWVPAVLTLVGFIAALRIDGYRWLAALHAMTGALYVVARSAEDGDLRFFMVGIWYNDASRLAALIPLTAVPLAALGVLAAARWVRGACEGLATARWAGESRGARRLAAIGRIRVLSWWRWAAYLAMVLALVMTGPSTGAMSDSVQVFEKAYQFSADSPSLTPDERALIDELPDLIERSAVVAVDPRTGAALAYALSGVDTTVKHLFHRHDPEVYVIQDKLNKAATDPAVCPALADLGATYALYFPGKTIAGQTPFPGFARLDAAPGFELVARRGQAALYRITACG